MKRFLILILISMTIVSPSDRVQAAQTIGRFEGNDSSGAMVFDVQAWANTEPGFLSLVFQFDPSASNEWAGVDPELKRIGMDLTLEEYEQVFEGRQDVVGIKRHTLTWDLAIGARTDFGPWGARRVVTLSFDNSKQHEGFDGDSRGLATIQLEGGRIALCTLRTETRRLFGGRQTVAVKVAAPAIPAPSLLTDLTDPGWKKVLQGKIEGKVIRTGLGLMDSQELGRLTDRAMIQTALKDKTVETFKFLLRKR